MNTFVSQIILTLQSAWATLLDCDRTVRPVAIQYYTVLTSEAAIKRYRIIAEITVRVTEILYLLAIALINDAQTRINRFVSESERKETTLPASEEIAFTFEEIPWVASPIAVVTDTVTTSVETIAVPSSCPLALPAAPPEVQKRRAAKHSTAVKKTTKAKKVVTAAG